MESFAKIVLTAVVAYAALVAVMYVMQRNMMYFPATGLPSPAAAGVPELSTVQLTTSDGLTLISWYAAPASNDKPVIVYFHGNGGNIAGRTFKTRPFTDAGYGLLLVSYRGYGGNAGSPTEDGLMADGRAALAFVAAQGIPSARTVVLGESLGSGVAVAMAAEHDVAAVILEAPYTSTADAGQRTFPFIPVKLLMKDRFDSLSRIRHIDAPLLIVHGERDRTIPIDLGKMLFAAAVEPKEAHFLPNAGHNDLVDHGLLDYELRFLERLFPGGS